MTHRARFSPGRAYHALMGPEWIFQPDELRATLRKLGFSSRFIDCTLRLAVELTGDASRRSQFLETARRYLDEGQSPEQAPPDATWRTLLALTGYPRLVAEHKRRGIPEAITQATAGDLRQWAEGGGSTRRGPAPVPLAWVLKPIRNHLLEVGRLQFLPASFSFPYRIFQHRKEPSKVVALAEAALHCSRQGWPVDGQADFETTLFENVDEVRGYAVNPQWGNIEAETTILRHDDWKLVLQKGDGVLDVHIPAGEALRAADCLKSFREAKQLFGKCFPEFSRAAFVCTSWLLDRELVHCLPSHSGILAFGNLFQPLPAGFGSFSQLIERVFDGREDWQTAPARTSLQKEVVNHFRSGGTFRTTSGFRLLKNDLHPESPARERTA